MSAIESWWAAGEHVDLELGGRRRRVFVHRTGGGPVLTLLHGFPSSSHDWAKVAPDLARTHALVMPDFLGFGASEKPSDHEYSIHEQADLVEALWAHLAVARSAVVAHDYAVSVVQELLARRAEGALRVELTGVTFLNGGLYPDLHRPEPVQTALLDPEQGPQISAAINRELIAGALQPTWGAGYDGTQDAEDVWRSLERDGGHRNLHLLIRYMLDRREHEARWVGALDTCDLPLSFVWGMQDPISGGHVAARLHERHPRAQITELADVGHWPPLEAPDRVAAAISAALAR
jgi:pimeloyl-ACP methyl ester carboxylesterase